MRLNLVRYPILFIARVSAGLSIHGPMKSQGQIEFITNKAMVHEQNQTDYIYGRFTASLMFGLWVSVLL